MGFARGASEGAGCVFGGCLMLLVLKILGPILLIAAVVYWVANTPQVKHATLAKALQDNPPPRAVGEPKAVPVPEVIPEPTEPPPKGEANPPAPDDTAAKAEAARRENVAAFRVTTARDLWSAGKKDKAREWLRGVIADYADTKAANDAQKLLDEWK